MSNTILDLMLEIESVKARCILGKISSVDASIVIMELQSSVIHLLSQAMDGQSKKEAA